MNVQYTKHCKDSALITKAEHVNGTIEGFAAVFDNVDLQGDIIRKGAFARTIIEKVNAGKVGLMVRHMRQGGDVLENIGQIVSAKEDDKGLFIVAELNDSQIAQETRSKIKQSPNMFGLSVGFKFTENGATDIQNGKEFTEIILMEVTVTGMPANEETNARAKSGDEARIEKLERAIGVLSEKVDDLLLTRGTSDIDKKSLSPVAQTTFDEANHRERVLQIMELENG